MFFSLAPNEVKGKIEYPTTRKHVEVRVAGCRMMTTRSPRRLIYPSVQGDLVESSSLSSACLQNNFCIVEHSWSSCWYVFALTNARCGDLILNYGKIAADHLRFPVLAGTILGKIARTCPDVLFGSCSFQSSDHYSPWSRTPFEPTLGR